MLRKLRIHPFRWRKLRIVPEEYFVILVPLLYVCVCVLLVSYLSCNEEMIWHHVYKGDDYNHSESYGLEILPLRFQTFEVSIVNMFGLL